MKKLLFLSAITFVVACGSNEEVKDSTIAADSAVNSNPAKQQNDYPSRTPDTTTNLMKDTMTSADSARMLH